MGTLASRAYDQFVLERTVTRGTAPLSRRELQVLALTAQGMTNKDVAQQLAISVHGVKFHLSTIYRTLGVGNRTEATVVYLTSLRNAFAGADAH